MSHVGRSFVAKYRFGFLCCLIFTLLISTRGFAQEVGDKVLTRAEVVVRTRERVVESVKKDSVLTVERVEGKWLYVRTKAGNKGWVKKTEVVERPPDIPAEKRESPNPMTPAGVATAFVIHSDGYLLTNAHAVLPSDKRSRRSTMQTEESVVHVTVGGNRYKANIKQIDHEKDLALLKIAAKGLYAIPIGDSDAVELGEDIRVLGYPEVSTLGRSLKVTRGTISGIEKGKAPHFQTDADTNPGNSGGPIVNDKGQCIAVHVAGTKLANKVNLSIPIFQAKAMLSKEGIWPDSDAKLSKKMTGTELVKQVAPAVAFLESRAVQWTVAPNLPKGGTMKTIRFSPDGTFLAGASTVAFRKARREPGEAGCIYLIHVRSGKVPLPISSDVSERRFRSLSWTGAGHNLIVAFEEKDGNSNKLLLWSLSKVLIGDNRDAIRLVEHMAPKPLSSSQKALAALDDRLEKLLAEAEGRPKPNRKPIKVEPQPVDSVVAIPNSNAVLVKYAYPWDSFEVRDFDRWQARQELSRPQYSVDGKVHILRYEPVGISEDGKTFLLAGEGEVVVFDLVTRSISRKITCPTNGKFVNLLNRSPDGRYVLFSASERKLGVLDTHSQKTWNSPYSGNSNNSTAFHGKYFVVLGSDRKSIQVYDLNTKKLVVERKLSGHSSFVEIDPQGQVLAAASNDGKIQFLDLPHLLKSRK